MELYINAQGGFAGDMFAAALISAGADVKKVTSAMQTAAEKLGKASVRHVITADGSSRMLIRVEHHHGHLSSHKALHLLEHLMEDLAIDEAYAEFGFQMLNALIQAEKIAHETHDFDMGDHHFHHHHHHRPHNEEAKGHESEHHHHHSHSHYSEPEAWLHEAQDILIDIMGAVMGLQLLGVKPKAKLLYPVAYGGGSVSFSHGTLKVPAPATDVMIKSNSIPVVAGPIEIELFTPTGAAALTALGVTEVVDHPEGEVLKQGKSRGTKDLPVPPLEILVIG